MCNPTPLVHYHHNTIALGQHIIPHHSIAAERDHSNPLLDLSVPQTQNLTFHVPNLLPTKNRSRGSCQAS
jgi:hypothetical protein